MSKQRPDKAHGTTAAERQVLRGLLQRRIEDGQQLAITGDADALEAWYQGSLADLRRIDANWPTAFANAGLNVRGVLRDQMRDLIDPQYKSDMDAVDLRQRTTRRISILREAKADLDSQDLLETARSGARALEASGLQPETFAFVKDASLRGIASRDYEELRSMPTASAKSRLVLAGSIVEAVLIDALQNAGVPPSVASGMDFATLITEAATRKLLRRQTEQAANSVRNYRNLVHPAREIRDGRIRQEDGDTAVAVMRLVLAELR